MKKMLFIIIIIPSIGAYAQPRISLKKTTNTLKPAIEEVARDYYQNFNNIKGDTLSETVSTIEFTSKVSPPDALSTSITKYIDPYSYTWEAVMFQSDEYADAVEKYKQYYKQLNGCKLTFYDKTSYKLEGPYDTPDEDRSFASSILQLDAVKHDLELFKVEVSLNYSMPEWTVKVLIYEKLADDKIRPTIALPVN